MKRGHILLLVALLGIPTLCSIALIADPGIAKRAYERRKAETIQSHRQQQALVDVQVSGCVASENPWRCFVVFEREDVLKPVASGASRTERMAALVSAKEVLAFCLEWRKVDCADRMIGRGWPRADLMAALERSEDPAAGKLEEEEFE
jgi:hypothetical protein